jgi:hypothetical protein
MRTKQQRIELMHARAGEIRKQKTRQTMMALSVFSCVLLAGIIAVMKEFNGLHQQIENSGLTGSSLLDSGAGGYVLVGVVCFVAAVIITVVCIRLRDKNRDKH